MSTVPNNTNSRGNGSEVMTEVSTKGHLSFSKLANGQSPVISKIAWTGQALEIHSEHLFSLASGLESENRRGLKSLIERLFRSPAVRLCDIQRATQKLTIRLSDGFLTTPLVLNQITQTLSDLRNESAEDDHPVAIWDEAPAGSFRVERQGQLLTTWQILDDSGTKIVLRQPALVESPELAGRTQSLLENFAEISKFTIDQKQGLLAISAIPGQSLNLSKLVHSLEQLSSKSASIGLYSPYPKADLRLPGFTLLLAITAQWFYPVVWPVPAVLIVYLNWLMILRSFKDLGQGFLGLPLLTTLIVLGTLAGGAFTASALMTVLARHWQNQYGQMLSKARREWLGQFNLPTNSATVLKPNGSQRELPVCKIQAGDMLELYAPTMIPADGQWLDGDGMIEAPFGLPNHPTSNRLYAGGLLKTGRVRMKVHKIGAETWLARLQSEVIQTSGTDRGETALNIHGQKFAEKTVLPTLALAGLGLATGDIGTAVAVMRPDYSTGVGFGEGLDQLRLAGDALHEGFLIRNASAVLNARQIQIWVIESEAGSVLNFEPLAPGQILAEIVSPTRIDLVNQGQRLTLQGFPPMVNDVDRVRLFQLLRDRGLNGIGWLGDASLYPNTAKAAELSLSTSSELVRDLNPASALSLSDVHQPNWNRLFEIVAEQAKEQQSIRRMALVPNAVAVAGAFTMGFTSLASVLLTNAGIWSIQLRTRYKSRTQRSYQRVSTAPNHGSRTTG